MQPLHSLVLALVLGTASLLVSAPALACKCAVPTVEAGRADATALFEGRVLRVAEETPEGMMPYHRVTLAVVRSWKGLEREEQVEAITNTQSAACGYPFTKDTSYLVYAKESEGKLHVSLCSRTKPMADAAEDLAVLGAGATPVRIVPKAQDAAVAGEPKSGPDSTNADVPNADAPKPDAPKAGKKRGCAVGEVADGESSGGLAALFALALVMRLRRSRERFSGAD